MSNHAKILSIFDFLCQPNAVADVQLNSTKLVVRSASAADAAAIAEIYADHVRTGTASFDTCPRTIEETNKKIADIQAKGWPFLVIQHDAEVIGYAYVSQFRDRAAYSFACEDSIYINRDWAGRGVGSILMRALIDMAASCGFRQMMAVVGGGEPSSIALHAKMGFEHAGRMRAVGRKFGRWLDTVYMQRELGDGDSTAPDHEPV